MDPILIPIMGILCGIVAIIGGIWHANEKEKMKLRARELEVLGHHTAEKAAQYAAHVERLEQRVRVLERIATDSGTALASEIDALADQSAQPKPLN